MELTIKSRVLGEAFTFSRPGREYIYVDTNGHPGTLGKQPTLRGGHTLSYSGDDVNEFRRICRNWYRSEIRDYKEHGSCALNFTGYGTRKGVQKQYGG